MEKSDKISNCLPLVVFVRFWSTVIEYGVAQYSEVTVTDYIIND